MKRVPCIALAAFLIASVFVLPARASVSLVNSWKATANNTTTPVAVTTATTSGDLLVAVYYTQATACPTLTAASGWTKSADSGCTSTKHDIAIFTHTATGETSDTPLASLSAAANQNVVIYDVSGANTGTPIDVSSFGAMAASTTPATPNITTTQNGDFLIAAWGNGTGTATASSITAGWAQIDNNNGVFQTVGSEAQTSAGAVTGPSATYASAPSSGVVATIAIAPAAALYNGLSATHAGGPHQSIAVSAAAAAVAPLSPWETYIGDGAGSGYNSMDHISPANAAKWCNYAQASTATTTSISGGDSGGANGANCKHAYAYTDVNVMEPTTSGVINNFPWTGGFTGTSCPASYKASNFVESTGTDAPNWNSSNPLLNWFVYEVPSGGTYGSNADRIQGYYGSTYTFFTNLASTSLQQSLQDAVQTCSQNGLPLDTYYEGFWNDNWYSGLQNNPDEAWTVMWGGGTYDKQINWGVVNGTPYAGSTCNGGPTAGASFFNGTLCTVSSQIDSVPMTSGNTTYGPDVGSGTSKTSTTIQGEQSMMAAIHHVNGSLLSWQFNGLLNGYAACQIANAEPNVTGGFDEEAVIRNSQDDGRLQNDATLQNIIDTASADYACGGKATFFLHDYLATENADYLNGGTLTTVTNGAAIGTATQQEDVRAHFFMLWLLTNDTYPQMMGSMTHACDNTACKTAYNSWTDVWPADFAAPSGRITPYPAQALGAGQYCSDSLSYDYNGTDQVCSQGGAHDAKICAAGTAPNCLFIATYNHFWVWDYTACSGGPDQTQWTSCAKDIGPFTVLYNLSGSAKTLSSANLSTWIGSTWASENYMLWPGCQPTSAAYGTTAGSTVYPGDNGGAAASSVPSTSIVCNGSTATDVYYGGRMGSVAKASILGTVLNDGESIGFTAAQP